MMAGKMAPTLFWRPMPASSSSRALWSTTEERSGPSIVFDDCVFSFLAAYTVSFGSQWKYTSDPQSGNSWRSQSYDDSAWSTYTAGHFPRYNQITRYYRYSGVFPAEIKEFPIAEVGIYSKEGVIVYINGIEVYRNNIDSYFFRYFFFNY